MSRFRCPDLLALRMLSHARTYSTNKSGAGMAENATIDRFQPLPKKLPEAHDMLEAYMLQYSLSSFHCKY